jgi:bacteriocin-like protein
MYELNEQELASVVGGHAKTEAEIEDSFNKSFNKNKVTVKNIKVFVKGDYSSATAAIYALSPDISVTAK